jgi:hypothetical protein
LRRCSRQPYMSVVSQKLDAIQTTDFVYYSRCHTEGVTLYMIVLGCICGCTTAAHTMTTSAHEFQTCGGHGRQPFSCAPVCFMRDTPCTTMCGHHAKQPCRTGCFCHQGYFAKNYQFCRQNNPTKLWPPAGSARSPSAMRACSGPASVAQSPGSRTRQDSLNTGPERHASVRHACPRPHGSVTMPKEVPKAAERATRIRGSNYGSRTDLVDHGVGHVPVAPGVRARPHALVPARVEHEAGRAGRRDLTGSLGFGAFWNTVDSASLHVVNAFCWQGMFQLAL